MPHLIKRSNTKVVLSGAMLEMWKYQKPFFYNFPPSRQKHTLYNENKNDRRNDNLIALRARLKRLIIANINQYKCKTIFITYTFASNIENVQEANKEWSLYVKRFDYWLMSKGFEKAKYITVIEFQKRGAVHYHTLYFNIPYIQNLKIDVARIWQLGFIKIISLDNVKYVASYVVKYLQKGLIDKRLIKQKAYFSSRNLKRPLLYRNNNQAMSIYQDFKNFDMIETAVSEKYVSTRYGLVEYLQIKKSN